MIDKILLVGVACFALGVAVGNYSASVKEHNNKVEFLGACRALEHELDHNQCIIMWYSRGAAH